MQIDGWRYYNHAAVPTTAPHEEPNIAPVKDGSVWEIEGGTPLFARWTTEFDCGHETDWWYLIKEAPFDFDDIPTKERKSIRQALRKNYVQKIDPSEYAEDLYLCYMSAVSKYENADNVQTKEAFMNSILNGADYWGGFDVESNKLIGYMIVRIYDAHAEIRTAKFDPDYLKAQVSDAIYFTVLGYYLNDCGKSYISSGTRNINHKTGTEEYKIRRFGYRKAFCRLHIRYNPKIKWLIKMLYHFRRILAKMDKITLIHQMNAVFKMEEIVRKDNV